MAGWVVAITFLLLFGVSIYHASRPETIAAEQEKTIQRNIDQLLERCVNGVVYYYASGTHNARLAPAVDAKTLTFKRCSE